MPRPTKTRFVSTQPIINVYTPKKGPSRGIEQISLSIEGLEALRLNDYERLDQETAAERMNISRQTFGRILNNARQIVSEALITGKELLIEGGSFEMSGKGRGCGKKRRHRGGRNNIGIKRR